MIVNMCVVTLDITQLVVVYMWSYGSPFRCYIAERSKGMSGFMPNTFLIRNHYSCKCRRSYEFAKCIREIVSNKEEV